MKKLILVMLCAINAINASAISDKEFTVQDVEMYMASLTRFHAKFDQIVPGEEISRGELFINRPGKFLWQYRLPTEVKIVSNGGLVYFVDDTTQQVTQVPNAGILFSLLSRKEVNFNTKQLSLHNLSQTNKRVNVDLIAKVEDHEVPVKIILQKLKGDKLSLMKIISKNQLDQTVVVSLYEQNENAVINKDIFKVEIEDEF